MVSLLVTVHPPVAFHFCGGWGAYDIKLCSRENGNMKLWLKLVKQSRRVFEWGCTNYCNQ